jgi:hypothetical protein
MRRQRAYVFGCTTTRIDPHSSSNVMNRMPFAVGGAWCSPATNAWLPSSQAASCPGQYTVRSAIRGRNASDVPARTAPASGVRRTPTAPAAGSHQEHQAVAGYPPAAPAARLMTTTTAAGRPSYRAPARIRCSTLRLGSRARWQNVARSRNGLICPCRYNLLAASTAPMPFTSCRPSRMAASSATVQHASLA